MLVREAPPLDTTASAYNNIQNLVLDGTAGSSGNGIMKRMTLPAIVPGINTGGATAEIVETATVENSIFETETGYRNIATGDYSHAEGYGTKATGYASHAEGGGANHSTEASGFNSHAEGGDTKAMGRNSHSEGGDTIAYAKNSHAEGVSSKSGFIVTVKVKEIESRTTSTSTEDKSVTLVVAGDYSSIYPVNSIINLVSNDNDGLSIEASYSYYRNFGKVITSTYNNTTEKTTLVIKNTDDELSTFSTGAAISHIEDPNSTDTK